jgi:hypothetical protein
MQRGGFASEEDARAALARALERLRREGGIGTTLTLAEFVDEYLDQQSPRTAMHEVLFAGRSLSAVVLTM